MKKIIITFVALIIGLICRAQTIDEHYYFKSLSSQNGLSQNTVSAILQDSKGFMWFGTKDGLDRYDGVSFRHFKYDRTNPRSLGNNFVTSLYEDVEGNIWVGTDVGVYIYYPESTASGVSLPIELIGSAPVLAIGIISLSMSSLE